MACGIFSFFRLLFTFFKNFKNSKQDSQERDVESNVIIEETKDEKSAEKNAPLEISRNRAFFIIALYSYLHFVSFLDQYLFMAILPTIKNEYQPAQVTQPLVFLGILCIQVILSPFITCATSSYNRKMVLCIGLFFYSFLSFGCTFIPQQGFWLFMSMRLLVAAMADSCLATVPLVIADLFKPEQRTRVLGFYTCSKAILSISACFIGIPLLELSSEHWRYALRITPALGLFGLVLAIIIMKNPEDMDKEEDESDNLELDSSFFSDLKQLLTNCSFLTFTVGLLCYAFVYGGNYIWARRLFNETRTTLNIKEHCMTTDCKYDDFVYYGVIHCVMTLIGLIIGMELSKRYNKRKTFDPILCGIGLTVSAYLILLFIVFQNINLTAAYAFIAIAGVFQAICQVPILNMKLNLVSPKLRKTSNVLELFFTRLMGVVTPSVFIIKVSEKLEDIIPNVSKLTSMQIAMTIIPAMAVIGAAFFLITAYRIKKKKKTKKTAEEPEAVIIQK